MPHMQRVCVYTQYLCAAHVCMSYMHGGIVCVAYVCCWCVYVIYMGAIKCMCVMYLWGVCVQRRSVCGVCITSVFVLCVGNMSRASV